MKRKNSLSSRIDDLFVTWDHTRTPGAQVAVVRSGELIHSRGYGSAQLEYEAEITPETVFHVASVSKQFTAAAVILLALDGKLALDDDIRLHVPEVPDLGHQITLSHLIHHTSGLRDQWELLVCGGWRMDDVITRDHIMKMVKNQRHLNFPPGAQHLYSNTGYTLLAEAVERVSGQSFREFCQTHIFRPLGMKRTHFHDDHTEVVPGRAYSYAPHPERGFRTSVLSYANAGATSLFTTAEDLTLWLTNLGCPTVGGEELPAMLYRRGVLTGGTEIDYAAGIRISEHRGLRVAGHSGADAGFRAWCGRFPDHDLGVVVLSNLATMSAADLAMKIAEICLEGEADLLPETAAEGPMPSESEKAACAGTYLMLPFGLVDVNQREGELEVIFGDGQPAALVPRGGLRFRVDPGPVSVSFSRDDNGSVDGAEIDMGGTTVMATRFCPGKPEPEILQRYVGDYWSEELQTFYTISFTGESLVMEHSRHEDVPLVAVGNHTFTSRGRRPGQLAFQLSGDRASGFTVTGGRVRDLVFVRV